MEEPTSDSLIWPTVEKELYRNQLMVIKFILNILHQDHCMETHADQLFAFDVEMFGKKLRADVRNGVNEREFTVSLTGRSNSH